MRPLKILHLITDSGGISGAERMLLGFAEHGDRARWSLAFATVRGRGPLNAALEVTGWPVHSLGVEAGIAAPRGIWRLRNLIQSLRPDILHTHLFHASVVGAAVGGFTNVTLVQTRHYSDTLTRFGTPTRRWLDRIAAGRFRAIAAVSDAAREQLVDVEGVASDAVRVIRNGVDWSGLSALRPEPGRALLDAAGVPRGPLIACAATFHPRKGLSFLVRAFARVVERVPNAQLVLLGRGPDQSAIAALVGELGLSAHVHLLGHRDDALTLLAATDVYTQPSVEEGFGVAVLEAMSLSKPVVVSNVGGMVETVEHEVCGLRVAPSSPEPLAEALVRVLIEPELAARFGRAGSERVMRRYSVHQMLADYAHWYDSLRDWSQ